MAIAREKIAPVSPHRGQPELKPLNAQQVTAIALGFLKTLGHKRGIKPKHVFIENECYVVEVEIGKKTLAKVNVDMITSEIKEYAIAKKVEEAPINLPVEPRALLIMFGVAAAVSILLALLDLQSLLGGLF